MRIGLTEIDFNTLYAADDGGGSGAGSGGANPAYSSGSNTPSPSPVPVQPTETLEQMPTNVPTETPPATAADVAKANPLLSLALFGGLAWFLWAESKKKKR